VNVVIARAEVGSRIVDVRFHGGLVAAIDESLTPRPGDDVIDACGGALLPGLHDHHLHLLGIAAAARSVDCGSPDITTRDELESALRRASGRLAPGSWLRGVGYSERVAGNLDRWRLDQMVNDRPVRLQHRSGSLWILNSCGLTQVNDALDDSRDVERDDHGEPTGRLWRYDTRLRASKSLSSPIPDLARVGRRLAAFGITGVTDATPNLDPHGTRLLISSVERGDLPQTIQLLGLARDSPVPQGLQVGPWKVHLRDHDLPSLAELKSTIAECHARGQAVAVHCVTSESLLLTMAAWHSIGVLPGDRVEHAAIVPPEVKKQLACWGVVVVTQPSFVGLRGDDYLDSVEPDDHDNLYPYKSLLDCGIRVAPSSDAPYGDLDPWRTMRHASSRRTHSGRTVGGRERVAAQQVLHGYLSELVAPGGPAREISVGRPADATLLSDGLNVALTDPSAERVRLTMKAGNIIFDTEMRNHDVDVRP